MHSSGSITRIAAGLVDAVDGADVDAGAVLDVDARLGDDVRHGGLLYRRQQPLNQFPRALEERRFRDHLVEAGGVRAAQPGGVRVVRVAEDRHVRDSCPRRRSASMRAMSAITRSGGSTPSVVSKRCSGSSASSLPRMKRSTPHSRIVAMPEPDVSTVRRRIPTRARSSRGRASSSRRTRRSRRRGARAPTDERDFFQGLVHVVVSAYQRGPRPARRSRAAAAQGAAAARGVRTRRTAGSTSTALLAALERAEPDPREYLVERDAAATSRG